MDRHQSNPLLSGCLDQSRFTHEIGVMAKTKICIYHRARRGGFHDPGRRVRFNLFHFEVFQIQVHVAQTHVPDAFSLCIRDLGRYDIRLLLACTRVELCISAESLYLRQGHDWYN